MQLFVIKNFENESKRKSYIDKRKRERQMKKWG